MFQILGCLLSSVSVWFRSNASVQLEIVALRQQLAVTHRKHPKPRLN